MLADSNTGMLIGMTQTFSDGTYYDEFRIGGTSLACPLTTAMSALAEQANGARVGFANPKIYKAAGTNAFLDVLPPATNTHMVRVDYTNSVDASGGLTTRARTVGVQLQTLAVTPGYDDVTGVGVPNGEAYFSALR
jgi:subtilase family serine protease